MADNDDSGEKNHDPTPKKLEDARKKGDVAKSNDLSAAMIYLSFLIAILVFGSNTIGTAANSLTIFLSSPDLLVGKILGPGGLRLSGSIVLSFAAALTPLFVLPFAAALLSLIGQQAIIVAPSKLAPKLNRISPLAGAKNKFGPSGLVEFTKTFIKMLAVSLVVIFYLRKEFDVIIGLAHASPTAMVGLLVEVLVDLLIVICALSVLVGIGDLLWQKYDHQKKLRMSFQDLKDEGKEAEGDPHTKAQRRQRGRDIATNRMLLDVPKADVVVVNPTHYAVALQWTKKKGSAPVCVAKGEDEIAARIREIAAESGVPIHSDPPTARAIHATVEVGHEIPPEQYRAIAAALRFAEIMRKKAKERGVT